MLKLCTVDGNRPGDSKGSALADDLELIRRILAGDQYACECLVRMNSERMAAVARRMLRCEEDAADAVQDAFISAFQSLPQFKGDCRLSTWLYRIAVNACLMRLRSRTNRQMTSWEELASNPGESTTLEPVSLRDDEDASLIAGNREEHSRIRSCVEQLPETYRQIVLLRDIHEYDTDETAELLGMSTANVKTRLHRARHALRPILEPLFTEEIESGRAA